MIQKELNQEEYAKFVKWAETNQWMLMKTESYNANKEFHSWLAPNGECYRYGVES